MLVLEQSEIGAPLPRSDRRVHHIVKVLKKARGDELLAGTTTGSIGTARIDAYDGSSMSFSFTPEREAPPLRPIALLLGFPRPIQANRILKDLASLGIGRILLSGTELGEKSYFQSDFFKNREFRAALIEGAEQAANPRLPEVETAWTLARALDSEFLTARRSSGSTRGDISSTDAGRLWALDPYRASCDFGHATIAEATESRPIVLAIGSERGWTPAELDAMVDKGFAFATMGDRILKTETAAVAACSIALARLGYL